MNYLLWFIISNYLLEYIFFAIHTSLCRVACDPHKTFGEDENNKLKATRDRKESEKADAEAIHWHSNSNPIAIL